MKKSIILVGVGEMGGVFARGLLKIGHPVYPVNRDLSFAEIEKELPDPEAVVVAVGEKDLHNIIPTIPSQWHDRVVFLQNELLPRDWDQHNIENPTVISVWFEKKRPNDYKVIIPSPVFGPKTSLIRDALNAIDISVNVLNSQDELLFELILKNLYILTTNIAGLEVGGNVGELWNQHQSVAREVANDVLSIQFQLAAKELDREKLIEGMVKAFEGDLEHKCMGRSAPARLERALSQAKEANLEVSKLQDIHSNHLKTA